MFSLFLLWKIYLIENIDYQDIVHFAYFIINLTFFISVLSAFYISFYIMWYI